eukprot:snap_masked-scaffold_7-processed-gene-19.59-mRNA-1 protein AED:1.00 eAED:1.00 QI:0/-1/0/0/-1/1/1/0/354
MTSIKAKEDICRGFKLLGNCGPFGTCVNNTCSCDEGWSQSLEFLFYVDDTGPEFDFDTLPCDNNLSVIRCLYGLAATLCLVVIIVYSSRIKKFSQLKRALPLLLSFSGFFTICAQRTIVKDVKFKEDVLFTVLFILAFYASSIATLIFLHRYIWYQKQTLHINSVKISRVIKRIIGFEKLVIGACTVGAVCFLVSVFSEDFLTAKIAFQSAFGLYLLQSIYTLIPGGYLISLLLRDVRRISTDERGGTRKKNTLREVVKSMKLVRDMTVILHVSEFTLWFLGAFTKFGMSLLKYSVPFNLLLGTIHSITLTQCFIQARRNRRALIAEEQTIDTKDPIVVGYQSQFNNPGSGYGT